MRTKEQEAALIYADGCDAVLKGGNSLRSLAGHIVAMVNGVPTRFDGPLWRVREFQQGRGTIITLDRFEDYLLKPPREGLGIPSLLWLRRVLEAHPEKDEREAALHAVRAEIPDFDEQADAQGRKELLSGEAAQTHGGAREGAGRKAKDLVDSVEAAKEHGGNRGAIGTLKKDKRKRGSHDTATIIARLKRDKDDESLPEERRKSASVLLAGIEKGEVKPYKAAKAMGYVKAPDPTAIVHKQREKLEPAEQVEVWREWGRALPDDAVDRFSVAQEAFINLYDHEQQRFLTWARKAMKGAA